MFSNEQVARRPQQAADFHIAGGACRRPDLSSSVVKEDKIWRRCKQHEQGFNVWQLLKYNTAGVIVDVMPWSHRGYARGWR